MKYLDVLGVFIFYYPIVMSLVWMFGGLFFYFRRERGQPKQPQLNKFPLVSIFIPARNEEQDIRCTLQAIFANEYPNCEVIVINDASTDKTLEVLKQLQVEYPDLIIINSLSNMGKANALNHALLISHGEIILTIDADSMLGPWAIHWAV